MIEGTSNPFGSIWCANVVRKVSDVTPMDSTLANSARAGENLELHKSETLRSPGSFLRVTDQWKLEALVYSTNFRLGFEPEEFQTILPKNLIHRVVPGESIHDF